MKVRLTDTGSVEILGSYTRIFLSLHNVAHLFPSELQAKVNICYTKNNILLQLPMKNPATMIPKDTHLDNPYQSSSE